MDTAVTVSLVSAGATVAVGLIAWHSATANNRANTRNAAAEAAERTRREFAAELEAARAATDVERHEYERLRDKRLREFANQLGSARQALAIARKEAAALASENEELRRALGHDGAEHGGIT